MSQICGERPPGGFRHSFPTFLIFNERKKELQVTTKRFNRREAIGVMGAAAGAALAFGCSDSSTSPSTTTGTTSTTSTTGTTNAACAVTPAETLGPYPSLTDLIRSDIRESKSGTVLTLTIKVVNANASCAAVTSANVEIWQCDAAGNYSEYGTQTAQTYLRGIQTTNSNGEVTFTTIYPGWYQGRATHIHIEVTIGGVSKKATQIAFPESVNNTVYATGVYASRGVNPMSNASDGIFADSLSSELVTPVGSPTAGYTAAFQVGISV
jgi:protocatechuate 3,4-dioxygenase beta subunit